MDQSITTPRCCTRCNGTKLEACVICNSAWRPATPGVCEGKPCTFCTNSSGMRPCRTCDGEPLYQPPVIGWLVEGILSSRGPRKGRICRSRPKLADHRNRESSRLYYVWRLARFHAGIDASLPIGADMEIGGDPFRPELDAIAQLVARGLTGHASIGRARWQQAMHGDVLTGAQDIDLMLATGEASE